MDPKLAISSASLELSLLRAQLEARAARIATTKTERNEIALRLPLISQRKRDLDRLFDALSGADASVPAPSSEVIDSLATATSKLSDELAADHTTDLLLAAATNVLEAASEAV